MTLDGDIIQAVLALLIGVIGYFLKQKDEKQGKDINELNAKLEKQSSLLWAKHDQDAKDLAELRLHIASQHYVKTELDARFDKMEMAFTNGFHELGNKLDKLTDVLIKDKVNGS